MAFKSEIRNGYTSSFKFQCQICNIESIIHSENQNATYIPINKALVNGSIAAGMIIITNNNYKYYNNQTVLKKKP